jgi:AraC-like DNA-binding protein
MTQALIPPSFVPLPALSSWRQAAHYCGFAVEPVMAEAGVVLSDASSKPLRVPPPVLFKAFSLCVERARGRHFPFALGDTFGFDQYTGLDKFISSCATLREMLEIACWARELVAPWMALHLDEFGAEAQLRVDVNVPGADNQGLRHVREVLLAALYQLIRRVMRGSQWLLSVRIKGEPPSHERAFTDHFGVPVLFGDATDALVMDRRWLDQPLNVFVPEVHSEARRQVALRVSRELGDRPIVDEVRWALERRPELLRNGLEATAAALGLHPRTLQRRLQAEGMKYVDVQSSAKCQRAQTMLRRRAISMEAISEELGFSDRRAFTYAFKRWTGLSPSAYRSQLELKRR